MVWFGKLTNHVRPVNLPTINKILPSDATYKYAILITKSEGATIVQ